MDKYILWAKRVIEGELEDREPVLPDRFEERKAAVFVTIYLQGDLRGCIGTLEPRYEKISDEIRHNAISSAFEDPRFSPLTQEEFKNIEISVDVLSEPERINSTDELDPIKYGVIVEKGMRKGVLLPNLDGVDTIEKQLFIALNKAGISSDEEINLYRFRVERYE